MAGFFCVGSAFSRLPHPSGRRTSKRRNTKSHQGVMSCKTQFRRGIHRKSALTNHGCVAHFRRKFSCGFHFSRIGGEKFREGNIHRAEAVLGASGGGEGSRMPRQFRLMSLFANCQPENLDTGAPPPNPPYLKTLQNMCATGTRFGVRRPQRIFPPLSPSA